MEKYIRGDYMAWLNAFIMVNLIGIGSNLDNTGVGMAYGIEKIKFPHWVNFIINFLGFLTAFLGAYLGEIISQYTSQNTDQLVSCIVLCGVGIYILYTAYLHPRISNKTSQIKLQKPGFKQAILLGMVYRFQTLQVVLVPRLQILCLFGQQSLVFLPGDIL
jgi:putative Mn2+ efflux pump MntP